MICHNLVCFSRAQNHATNVNVYSAFVHLTVFFGYSQNIFLPEEANFAHDISYMHTHPHGRYYSGTSEQWTHYSEVVPSEVLTCIELLAGGMQFVHCREVVCSSECPLLEVPLYIVSWFRKWEGPEEPALYLRCWIVLSGCVIGGPLEYQSQNSLREP